jgi:hypothetical protein
MQLNTSGGSTQLPVMNRQEKAGAAAQQKLASPIGWYIRQSGMARKE